MTYSFLHFGQNSGKLSRTVSSYTFVRVLLLQVGQRIHRESFVVFSILPQNNHSFELRYRKVTISPRVQVALGAKVSADLPVVTPFSTAQATASA